MSDARCWQFWIDTGGTFTDCLACTPDGEFRRLKVLSSGAMRARVVARIAAHTFRMEGMGDVPDSVPMGCAVCGPAGNRLGRVRSWSRASGILQVDPDGEARESTDLSPGAIVDVTAGEEAPVLAMRILTDTPPGAPLPAAALRLATTRATNALLEGRGARVAFFVTAGFADLLVIGDQRRPDLFALRVTKPPPLHGPVIEVRERLAADGTVVQPVDVAALREAARKVRGAGIEVAAVALLHSYGNPRHEVEVAAVLRESGFTHVSLSSALAPFIKFLPRAETAVVDAVLAPVMASYLDAVAQAVGAECLHVMTSAGGLVRPAAYRPKDSLLSGPAGGVAGAAAVARRAGIVRAITFDMGGTSTDVARWDGEFDYRFQHAVGTARVFAPAVRVESVAAGGGSICRFDGEALVVGPESAGATPGPACYGAGGPLTLTDVNLLLGRIAPGRFGVPIFPEAAREALAPIVEAVRGKTGVAPAPERMLRGFLDIADERMAEAIRRISVREGYDPAEHALIAFGGAGGLHACAIAERLGIRDVLIPGDAGLLSACGLRAARAERFAERQVLRPLAGMEGQLEALLVTLEQEARDALRADGLPDEAMPLRWAEAELRFSGQEAGLRVPFRPAAELAGRFREAYAARYGYLPDGRAVEVVALRVCVSTRAMEEAAETFAESESLRAAGPVRLREDLSAGAVCVGPCLVPDRFGTVHVAPGWRAVVGTARSLRLSRGTGVAAVTALRPEVVELELFTCRFRAIVDEMGGLLQRCAVSVNVRDREDFSCALLDPEGFLVANAPHIPVHLGALGLCVRLVREAVPLAAGDVVVTNHPGYGGSHLPDVTLIAPVHADDGTRLGYVANRAHHAEIGGLRPGSMSPEARRLAEEGVVLTPFPLVRGGVAQWEDLRRRLEDGPHPSRAVDENLADLHAQLAAIRRGAAALQELARSASADRVRHFMRRLQYRAAEALASALAPYRGGEYRARDALDDGSTIAVACRWRDSRLEMDFAGSAAEHPGNLNATPAIVRSAVMYVLRVLAGSDLPLNEGFLRDVDLVIPPGILAPHFPADPWHCPAVAGGNVETSQRVVDVLLAALGLAAGSQGTMNNVVLGTSRGSFYETVGGGTGAGPGFAGCDAVHSHMTNTAITDAEILEARLPVRVEHFGVRRGSGGGGRCCGGDGIVRVLRMLEPATLSLLAQRRRQGPPGLAGGRAGAPGSQRVERAGGTTTALDGVTQVPLGAGDRLVMETPGGGGWGEAP